MSDAPPIAPPAIGENDPIPAGRIAMWLVIAADLMFFLGLVGAFLVLRAGNAALFADHEAGLHGGLALVGVIVLLASSVAMQLGVVRARESDARGCALALVAVLVCAAWFGGLRTAEYLAAFDHHTIVARPGGGSLVVLDGQAYASGGQIAVEGYASPLPANCDVHTLSEADVAGFSWRPNPHVQRYSLAEKDVFQDMRYGPGKNIFYATWYLLTGAHLVHVAIGMIVIALLLVQVLRRKDVGRPVEYAGLYWHFVVSIGIALYLLLYLSSPL